MKIRAMDLLRLISMAEDFRYNHGVDIRSIKEKVRYEIDTEIFETGRKLEDIKLILTVEEENNV